MKEDKLRDLTEDVTEKIDEMEDETPIDQRFRGGAMVEKAINEVTGGDLKDSERGELREQVDMWLSDSRGEPSATVVYNGEERRAITPYDKPRGFDTEWHSTDAWRGHYSVESSDNWMRVNTDTILTGHHTEKDLKEMQERLREEFKRQGIEWVEVYPRTSNVFATGFDIFVKKGDKEEALKTIAETKEKLGMKLDDKERRLKNKLDKEV